MHRIKLLFIIFLKYNNIRIKIKQNQKNYNLYLLR
jgi:hypothetical protein